MFMQSNGFFAEVNLPNAPTGEGVHNLPPYNRQKVYTVDEYPACPANWPRGDAKTSSYFLPVMPGRHLWLDFNKNVEHTHHVAIVLNVQGVNPITGPIGDQKPSLKLEQYREKCPIHDVGFKQDRYCEECEFKWPAQNYITTVSTPRGLLWVDGWRAQGGEIRGFLITAETMRGVAAQLIGDERVFAIGMAFFPLKTPKPIRVDNGLGVLRSMSFSPSKSFNTVPPPSPPPPMVGSDELDYDVSFEERTGGELEVEKLEIGAGARIKQELSYPDPTSLNDYSDEPGGMIYINYCTESDFQRIMNGGRRDMTKDREGFLSGLNVGNR